MDNLGFMNQLKQLLGPGILFAATAIGVSHLVQSTKAGAMFGFSLIGFVALANVLKYPFFEYGSRYAAATGESIISGYYRLHRFWLYAYLIVTFISMMFVTAAVGAVTIGFMENLFGLSALTGFSHLTHYLLFGGCTLLLVLGRFNVLEKLVKVLGVVLLLTTIFAFFAALYKGPATDVTLMPALDQEAWVFLLPLMGWMPTAIDLSSWNSLWTVEKAKQSNEKFSVKQVVQEFGIGYWSAAILAFLFLTMGAMLVYGTAVEVPGSGAAFSSFVIALYTSSIGEWSFYIISAAAFSIMLSTFLTVVDGFSRAILAAFSLALHGDENEASSQRNQRRWAPLIVAAGGLALILIYEGDTDSFSMIVNAATTLSFVIAPLIAALNFRLVMRDKIGSENTPGKFLKGLSWLGMIYLVGFLIWFVLY